MASIVEELKTQARLLHKGADDGDEAALARIARARRPPDAPLQRRHCLSALALELGFSGWPHARAILEGESPDDFGTLLYQDGCGGHANIWSAAYDEARAIRSQHGGYLLAYKRHFLIVEASFVDTLGLDPDDPDWEAIGRDWVRPTQPPARNRLYARLVRNRLGLG